MINIIVSSDPRYHINKSSIQTAALAVLQAQKITGKIELEVNIVGDRKMHELNKQYRGLDQTTDILSFAFEDPHPRSLQLLPRKGFIASPDRTLRLGSIVISYPRALEDASSDGISVEEEVNYLVEHGVMHLLGFHHPED